MVRSFKAFPPISPTRAGKNLYRGNTAVFGGVPLGGNVRMEGRKGGGNRDF